MDTAEKILSTKEAALTKDERTLLRSERSVSSFHPPFDSQVQV